jgi:hypothetical protein
MNSSGIPIKVLVSQALSDGRLSRRRRAALRDSILSLRRPLRESEKRAMEVTSIDPAEVDLFFFEP